MYDTSDEIRHLAQWVIIITASFFPLQGFLNVLYFTLRSGGKTVITFLFDSVFTWVVSVSIAFILCRFTTLPILAIYLVLQAVDMIKVVIGYILVKKGIWITNLVVYEREAAECVQQQHTKQRNFIWEELLTMNFLMENRLL